MSDKVKHSIFNDSGVLEKLTGRGGEALDELWGMSWVKSVIGDTSDLLETADGLGGEMRHRSQVIVIVASDTVSAMIGGAISAIGHRLLDTEIFFAGGSLSSEDYSLLVDKVTGRDFSLMAIAIQEETLEQRAAFTCVRKLLQDRYGADGMIKRTILVGNDEYFGQEMSRSGGKVLTLPEDAEDCYAAGTMAVLLPMAAAGIDVAAYLEGFKEMLADTCWDADGVQYGLYLSDCGRREDVIVWQKKLLAFGRWVCSLHDGVGIDAKAVYMPAQKKALRRDAYGMSFVVEVEDSDTMLPAFPGCNAEGSMSLLLREEAEAFFGDGESEKQGTLLTIEKLNAEAFGRLAAYVQISLGITKFNLDN